MLSVLISLAWRAVGLPAALLLGPLISGIVLGVNSVRLTVPRWPYVGAQAVVGALVAAGITPAIVATFGHDLLLFAVVVFSTLLAAASLGWVISRFGLIPGATAVYGTSPGAAGAMVLISEAEGADPRMVAFMQYSRVLLVILAAAVVSHLWGINTGAHHAAASQAPVRWENLATVLVLAAAAQQAARVLGLQSWALLGPLLLLAALHATGLLAIVLPSWLLTVAYALVGWHIGLGFRRDALIYAGRALPVVIATALCLIGFCALLAWLLVLLVHTDPLTAYLATSPGGIDSVAAIAASTPRVDLPFVLALQSVRLMLVIGLSPLITRLVVRHSPHLQKALN